MVALIGHIIVSFVLQVSIERGNTMALSDAERDSRGRRELALEVQQSLELIFGWLDHLPTLSSEDRDHYRSNARIAVWLIRILLNCDFETVIRLHASMLPGPAPTVSPAKFTAARAPDTSSQRRDRVRKRPQIRSKQKRNK